MIKGKFRTWVTGDATGLPGGLQWPETEGFREFYSRILRWLMWTAMVAVAVGSVLYEMRTSALESWILSAYAKRMSYSVKAGPSPSIVFPHRGPFDLRSGYALIPDFIKRLEGEGYHVSEQARFSPDLLRVTHWGIVPPFRLPVSTRLTIEGMGDRPLFQAPIANHEFKRFEDIPPLAIKALLLIENRELEEPADYRSNPVVDWDRLAKAALLYTGRKLGLPVHIQGGSTLATQMQKYRYSDQGRTDSIFAKLRQMTGASLLVYRTGPDTRAERRQIILDYMNSVPLAAAPRYGEVHGLGNGLYAWFGRNPETLGKDLDLPGDPPAKIRVFKEVLELLCAVRAPSYYLLQNHPALEARVRFYIKMLVKAQVIEEGFANRLEAMQVKFSRPAPSYSPPPYAERKAADAIRKQAMWLLGIPGLYELDRLHLDIDSTIDATLQQQVMDLFRELKDPAFISAAGLRGKHLLPNGDPSKVIYGMLLYEKAPLGNLLRVETDNLNSPFDINDGMKMQLGSTAKLRTLANYLAVVASLHERLSLLKPQDLSQQVRDSRDPITRWGAATLFQNPGMSLDGFLQRALDRKYSASPSEAFFTGGGIHHFKNFEAEDNLRILTVREATERSVNLVYIRLMRDLVQYYQARLPYNTDSVLNDEGNPVRRELLEKIAEGDAKYFLSRAYNDFRGQTPDAIVARLLGKKVNSVRALTILFYAWHPGGTPAELASWLAHYGDKNAAKDIEPMAKAYGHPRLNLADFGYLLGIHPLNVWCAGQLARRPSVTWAELWGGSDSAREISSAWLFKTRNLTAQNLRLRIRFEQDAFQHMTPVWQRLGFPFEHLVPSYATAIGSSGDRPAALATLMGILLNDGIRRPSLRLTRLRFARGTPYETTMEPVLRSGERVLPSAVARAILPVLAGVVRNGTAVRAAGVYKLPNGAPLTVGGKTGSGDNEYKSVGRAGEVLSEKPVNRTAAFVFYIGDRYFGVITAYVPGEIAAGYSFTSSLPVTLLRLLAPAIENRFAGSKSEEAAPDRIEIAELPKGPGAGRTIVGDLAYSHRGPMPK
jgi:membrane peptidoglycan carboxypeptidase